MDFKKYIDQVLLEAEQEKKSKDIVCINSALLMRLFELVHEEIEDDEPLHHMVEKIYELSHEGEDRVLTMDDYDVIQKAAEAESKEEKEESEKEEPKEDKPEEKEEPSKQEDEYEDE